MRTVWVSKYLAIFSNRTWYGFTIVIHRDSSLWCSSLSNQPKNVCFISWQILWPLHFCEVRTLRVTRTNHHCQRKQPQRSRTRTTSHQATFAMFAVFCSSFHGNGKSMRISYFVDYLHFIHMFPVQSPFMKRGYPLPYYWSAAGCLGWRRTMQAGGGHRGRCQISRIEPYLPLSEYRLQTQRYPEAFEDWSKRWR